MNPAVIEQRFWAKVERRGDDECWPWKGGITGQGYGSFRYAPLGRNMYAHRMSFFFANGHFPPEATDHLCRNRRCVNPNHLEAVSQRENNRRAAPTHCKRGHEFTAGNTYRDPAGSRRCRECIRLYEELPHVKTRRKELDRRRWANRDIEPQMETWRPE